MELTLRPAPYRPLTPLLLALFFTCLTTASGTGSSNSTDRNALFSFKSLISDGSLGALASWDNQILPYCQWRGVTCGDPLHPGRVTALALDSLNLAGSLSSSIANLTFLSELSLSNNRFTGPIPPELGRLSQLQVLALSNNSLSGEIPANISQCSRLVNLSLDTNLLSGGIPHELGSLSSLVKLNLYTNNLTGFIPASLGNLSSLITLDLSGNNLEGSIPETLSRLTSLEFLQLSINRLSGKLPPSLCNFSSVFYYDIGSNQLSGALPLRLGSNLPSLRKLYLYSNQFEGSIPVSLSNASKLERLGLEQNSFSGLVPPEIGAIPGLSWLALGNNRLHARDASDWEFLTALTNRSNLQVLELSDNNFAGLLPSSIANLSTQLEWLSMEDNEISGSIPTEMGRYVNLTFLSMYNNLLAGSIPASIGRLQNLNILRLSGNQLSGEIPASLGNLTQLNELDLGGNRFYGSIPRNLGNLGNLDLLNLSCNKLNGTIPEEIVSMSSLTRYLDMSHNSLTGSLPPEVGSLINLWGLNLSENKLIGEIPGTIGGCQVLGYLLLEGNSLQGIIPSSLSDVKGIQELDLSRNNLSGQIPQFLQSFQFLQYLNLSFNDFEGEVPDQGIFGNSSAFSVVGNSRLCGGNQDLHLQECSIQSPSHRHESHKIKIIIIAITVCILVLFLGLFSLRSIALKSRKRSLVMASSSDHHSKVSYAELFQATGGFSSANLIGVGSFGSVFKGIMDDDEKIVAVKVLNLRQQGASRSFVAECEVLRNTRHRNLVKVLTSCASVDSKGNDFKALVLEFMPNGSLEEWLHPEARASSQLRKLSFISRLNIAVDVAYALDYLHHHGQIPIVHCDLKPSNVLLDADMVAHVSDFGLAKVLSGISWSSSEDPVSSLGVRGSIGYIAPEYGMGKQVSTDGDVYSYGILLLEMFTAKAPTDEIFKDGLTIHKHAEMAFPERILDIIDPDLLAEEVGKDSSDTANIEDSRSRMVECLVSVVGIAISCSKESPMERGNMATVVNEMVAARNKFTRKREAIHHPKLWVQLT